MEGYTVLVIDDEPINLRVLSIDLEDAGYHVLTASDGEDGLRVLKENRNIIKTVLLDRMMPNLDGMGFLEKIKNSQEYKHLPIIMQTAAAQREEVLEGINAGVYYYLTKPYEPDVMLSLVRAACSEYAAYTEMRSQLKEHKQKIKLIKQGIFEVTTLDDSRYLATFLCQLYPNPDRAILGISELLTNAVEHGNLGITYDEKTELNNKNSWEQEVNRRLALDEYKDKKVIVTFVRETDKISLKIEDEGDGFDWQEYLNISAERATDNHGRGIAMARMMSFDEMHYLGNGNTVVVHFFCDGIGE